MPRAKASLLMILTTALTVAVLFLLPYTPSQIVRTVAVQKGEWTRSVLVSGVVAYADEAFCISPQSGEIIKVYAQPGQRVCKGDLLFSMDISAFESALETMQKARYEHQSAFAVMEDSIRVLAMARELEWQETEMQLRQAIELSQVRAQMDGTVDAVYAVEGSYVEAASLLGSIHDGRLCIKASAGIDIVSQIEPGASAILQRNGKTIGAAQISRIHAPSASGQSVQSLTILPLNQAQLAQCETGERITAEILLETIGDRVLIPLSAVDGQGRVWYVENGRAYAQELDVSKRNGDAVAASQEWEGRRIILMPDHLYDGCPVKEAKR